MADETFVTELLIDASQALRSLLDYQNGLKGAAGSTDALNAEIANLNEQIRTTTDTVTLSQRQIAAQESTLVKQSTAYGGVAGSVIQLNKALNDIAVSQNAATRQMQMGSLSAEAGQAELAKLALQAKNTTTAIAQLNTGQTTTAQVAKQFPEVFSAVSGAYGRAANDIKGATTQFGLNRQGFLELQAAGINTFQALAAGMGVMRTAEMEAAQVVGALIQGQKLSISTLISWVLPIGAATAAIGILTYAVIESNSQIKAFNTTLIGMGTAGASSAAGLQAVMRQLRDTGTAAADAQAAIQTAIRTPGINPAPTNVGMITNLARDIGAVTGGSIVDETKKLSDALVGGEAAAEKYAFALAGPNGLTAAEAISAQAMAKSGDTAGALNVILAALARQYSGAFTNSLNGTDRAINALAASWHNLLDGFTKSDAITTAIGKLAEFYKGASDALTELQKMPQATAATEARIMALRYGGRGDIGGATPENSTTPANQYPIPKAPNDIFVPPTVLPPAVWPFNLPASTTPVGSGPVNELPSSFLARTGIGSIPGHLEASFPTRQNADFGGSATISSTTDRAKNLDAESAALNRNTIANKASEDAKKLYGLAEVEATARTAAYNAAIAAGKDPTAAMNIGIEAGRHALADANTELAKAVVYSDAAAAGALKVADAYQQSDVAGLQAAASVAAQGQALKGNIDYQTAYTEALRDSADAALTSAAQSYAAGQRTLQSNQDIAAAATKGVAAERDAQQLAQATAQTQDAVNKAKATGNDVLIAEAQRLQDVTLAQIKANDAAKESTQFSDQARGLVDQQAVLQLQISLTLQGKTTDEIAKQVTLLQLRQTLAKANPGDDQAVLANLQAQTTATAQLTQNLQLAQQSEQKFEQGLVGIADTISSSIGTSIQNSFDNKTVLDWGATLKNVLAQIINQIAQLAFIKPAIGSVLSLIGLQGAAQQFGTFGTLLNGIGSIGGAAAGATGTGSGGSGSGSGVNIPNVPLGGLLNGSSGIGGAINTAGYSTGLFSLAPSEAAVSTAALYGGGGEAAVEAGIQGVGGLGEGAIGASLGGILGIAAPVIGLLGAVLPLVLGGIGKGSQNNSSSANLGPNGQISLSGPNQANSQQASAVLQQLSPLVQALKSLGYNVPTVGATYGTKTGIQTGISGFDEVHYGSNAEAVAGTAQRLVEALGKLNPGIKTFADLLGTVDKLTPTLKDTKATFDSLSGVFTTTQTNYQTLSKALMSADVSVTDVTKRFNQLGAAIISAQIDKAGQSIAAFLASGVKSVADFASAYSALSTQYQTAISEARAAHQAFTPITNDFSALAKQLQGPELQAALSGLTDSFKSLQPGQYAAALDQIGQVFNSIFAQAAQFNVAGPDIWNTQDQAKANLRTAFNSQISDLILGFTNPAALAIKQEKAAGTARVADAKAIGANVTEVNKLNALSLQKVIDSTKTLTTSATSAANSVQQLVDAINQLKGGTLSGLTPGKQAQASFQTFETTLKAASWGKDPNAFNNLGSQATATVQAFQAAFGNTGMTEAYREVILAQLQQALKAGAPGFALGTNADLAKQLQAALTKVFAGGTVPGFASGTLNTPRGAIIVGERGPELMIQRGGNAIVPLPAANSNARGGDNGAMIAELRTMRAAFVTMSQNVVTLNRQVQGGQIQAHEDATEANKHLGTMKTSIVHAAATPRRRSVA